MGKDVFVYTSSVCLTTTGSSATGVFSSIQLVLEANSFLGILPFSCLIVLSLLDTDGAAAADAVVVDWTGAGAAVVVAVATAAATGWGDETTGAALVVAATRLVGTA